MSPELRQLGRTLHRWADEIVAWHHAQVSNGLTEATNTRRFHNYRLRVLLYAGRPNWDLLTPLAPAGPPGSLTSRQRLPERTIIGTQKQTCRPVSRPSSQQRRLEYVRSQLDPKSIVFLDDQSGDALICRNVLS